MRTRLGPARKTLLAGTAVVVVASIIAFLLRPSQADLEGVFAGGGVVGPVLYVGAYVLLTVAFVPGAPMTLAAGALYGVGAGTAVSMIGATGGAMIAFAISRRSAGGSIERAGGVRFDSIRKRLEGNGFYALLALRLLPVVPFNALNYAAGASSIGVRDYALATVIGIAPGALVYASLGAGLNDPVSPLFIGAAALAVVLAIAARIVARRRTAGDAPVRESKRGN